MEKDYGKKGDIDIEWYEYSYNLRNGAKVSVIREIVFSSRNKESV